MKKAILVVFGMVVAFSMCVTTAFAAKPRAGYNYVDADNNGVCDNVDSGCVYADIAGAVLCADCGMYHRNGADCGRNYVDEDDDGVCDNYVSRHHENSEYGHHSRRGHRGGHGRW